MQPKPDTHLLVVADGGRARIFRAGRALHLLEELSERPAPNRDLVSDRPGRRRTGSTLRNRHDTATHSMAGRKDWHGRDKKRFLARLAERLDAVVNSGAVASMVLVAPPASLGELRHALGARARRTISAEVRKDLTSLTPHALQRTLEATQPSPEA